MKNINYIVELKVEEKGCKLIAESNIDYFTNEAEEINFEQILEFEESYMDAMKVFLNNTF